jgi:integrase
MNLTEAIQDFLHERQGNTRTLAEQALRYYAEWFEHTTGEVLTLENWTTTDLRDYRTYLINTKRKKGGGHLQPSTVNTYNRALSSFCNWCADHQPPLMPRNPMPKKFGVQIQPKDVTALDRNQENKLLRILEADDPLKRFIVLFLMNTGLRNSELVSLTLQDIWLGSEDQTLNTMLDNVPQAKAFRSGMVIVRQGKGTKYREVDLNAVARQTVLDYLKVRPRIESDRVLISLKRRAPLTKWGIIEVCRRYERLLDSRLHAHLLRHTFGTKVTRASSIEVAADLLGHSSSETTRSFYVQRDTAARKNAIDQIGEM